MKIDFSPKNFGNLEVHNKSTGKCHGIIRSIYELTSGGKELYSYMVTYISNNGRVNNFYCNEDGANSSFPDIIVRQKPVIKEVPFTHEDILELIGTNTVFRHGLYNDASMYVIAGYDGGVCKYRIVNELYSYNEMIKYFMVSHDKGKTWRRLVKEVTE